MAVTSAIELFLDITNKKLVTSLNNATAFKIGEGGIYQGASMPLRIYPVKPLNTFAAPFFQLVPTTGLTWDVGIGPRDGVEALLARQNVWVDSGLGYFSATLNLNTTDLNTAIGSSDSFSTYFEIYMSDGGAGRTVYQETISIIPVVIGPSGATALPAPASQFYTAAQMDAILLQFVRFVNNPPGESIELTSLNGNTRVLAANDDGSAGDEHS